MALRATGEKPVNGVFEIPVELAKFGADTIDLRTGKYHLRSLQAYLRV
jgi:hypothetical protein